jgi:hypothetical protein
MAGSGPINASWTGASTRDRSPAIVVCGFIVCIRASIAGAIVGGSVGRYKTMPKIDNTGYPVTYDAYFSDPDERGAVSYGEISARLASAQFAIASDAIAEILPPVHTHTDSDARTPTIPLLRVAAVPPQRRQVARPVSVPAVLAEVDPMADEPEPGLPATWYNRPAVTENRALSPERHAFLVRTAAAGCLTLAAGLLFWLNTMSRPPATPTTPSAAELSASLISNWAPPAAISTPNRQPKTDALTQDQISTAQILAVAERFVATGDVLAARAMLQDRAGAGEPRALFALAETYDPHMLASWDEKTAEASVTYARFLYEAARRGGVAEAKTRLDALR